MTDKVKIAIEQLERISNSLASIGETVDYTDIAIQALEQQPITWIVGKDNCQVAVRNMPIDKMQKICAIIGEEEQQPCEDCISRQVVKDMLTAEWTKYMPMELDMNLSFILDKISAMPYVTPKTEWIPVSERLPEKQDCYLVTTKWKGSYSGDVYIETNMAVYREKPKEWDCKDVIAWMPLPHPYKAESEDKG